MASLVLLFSFLLYDAAAETVVVQVKPGQDVTLECNTSDTSIRVAEWIRSDPKPSMDILFWRGGKTNSLIEGRVQLVNNELKNGNVSLILKNVSRDDIGTYECRVVTAGSSRKKRANIDSKPISRVELQVTDSEYQKGHDNDNNNNNNNGDNLEIILSRHHVGLGAAAGALVCSAAVGLFVSKSKRQRDKKPESSAAEETGVVNLL